MNASSGASAGEELFDVGLQPERTALAWYRTCLALVVGVAVAVRYTAQTSAPVAAGLAVVGAGAALGAAVGARRRYRRAHRSLVGSGALDTGGRLPAAVAGALVVVGVICVTYVLGEVGA